MFKESVICILIITAIFSINAITQSFTKKAVEEITEIFTDLKENILNKDKNQTEKELKTLDEKWKGVHEKLAYYIEHDELEKVDTAIVKMKAYVETEDFSSAIAELDEGKFVIEHIQEKYALNLKNIF